RAMGLLELSLLVALAVRFARIVTTSEAAACVVACVICCGGLATLFTGYSKPTPPPAPCALAPAPLGVGQGLAGRGRVPFALAVAAGLALHRGGLPLLVPWAVVSAVTLRRGGLGAGPWPRRLIEAAALALPLAVVLVEARALAAVITSFDVPVNF